MDIADCYRVLGLTSIATAQEVKSSYRRLARKWHPDVNPNNQHAHDMFIRVTEAYKVLLTVAPSSPQAARTSTASQAASASTQRQATPQSRPSQSRASQTPQTPRPQQPPRSQTTQSPAAGQEASSSYYRQSAAKSSQPQQAETSERPDPSYEIKLRAYEQLQNFLQMKRYPRAIALIEALSQKLPEDPEIRQWQAIIYQRWGRQLIAERKYNQARAYLKKAYTTDPKNKSLLTEIERDLKAIKMSV